MKTIADTRAIKCEPITSISLLKNTQIIQISRNIILSRQKMSIYINFLFLSK